MKLTRIDLNSWILQIGGQTILVDPWLVDSLVLYGQPWLFQAEHSIPLAFTPDNLPPIDVILLSQGIDDHTHRPTLERLDRTIPVVASPTAAKIVQSLGFHQVTALSHWQEYRLNGLQIMAVQGAELQPGQIENGYLLREIETQESLYYEPHLFPAQAALAERLGSVSVVLAPVVGQRVPLLGQVIMGPEEALELAHLLRPRSFVPTTLGHVRVSGLLPSLIQSIGSVAEFRDRLRASGLPTHLLTPEAGETIDPLALALQP